MFKNPGDTYFHAFGTIIGSESLTTVFGMGTGVAFPIWSPGRTRAAIKPHRVRVVLVDGCSYLRRTIPHQTCHWSESNNMQFASCLGLHPELWIKVAKHSSVSTSKLNPLLSLHIWPINLVVFKGTSPYWERNLISERASRLDAFSVYPFRS